MTDNRTLEAKQYDDIFSPREISKIKQEFFWVMQQKTVDSLTLEIYRDLLIEMQRQLNQISNMTPYVLWGERHDNIQIEIETLNTILS